MSGDRVSLSIPSLINGISQQAPEFRLSSQADLQENTLSAVLDGISKRPPTEHLAKISDVPLDDAFIHTINRDKDERYVVAITNGNLRVFDMQDHGREMPVAFPDGKAYLNSTEPHKSFRVTTIVDYSFVLNRDVPVLMDETHPKETEKKQALVFVKKGVISTTYKVMVNGYWASYTTPEPSSTVTSATSGTTQHIAVNPVGWTWTQCYNWLLSNSQPVLGELNPYTWSDAYRAGFYVAGAGYTPGAMTIVQRLDWPDEELQYRINHPTQSDPAQRYINLLSLKNSMRNYVTAKSNEMAAAGITNSVTTTINEGSQPSTDRIAAALGEGLRTSLPGFSIEVLGSSLLIYRPDNQDFTFAVTDSWGNEAMVGVKREVQKFSDLPARCWDGFRVRIVGENPSKDDDYYLEYSSDSFYKNGVWKECCGWEQLNRINSATMPHTLIREADGTFTFKRATWRDRKCGDDYSVPWPSFVEARIEDVFFYRNRLGFIADENVILSGAGEYFQFWPDTATSVLPTDPIDFAVSGAASDDRVTLLRYALPFEENLILFADQNQFQLGDGGSNYLAPDTARVNPTTYYECSALCKPVCSGQGLYFVSELGDFSAVREYTVSPDSVSGDAPEVTSHIPKYLPKGMFKMTNAVNDGALFAISKEAQSTIFVYRFFWVGEEKVQSSWSRWTLADDAKILSIACIQSSLSLVVQYPDGVFLERLSLNTRGEEAELGFKVHLDRKLRVLGTYNEDSDTTTWELPYLSNQPGITVMLGDGFTEHSPAAILTNSVPYSPNTIKAGGRYDEAEVIVGIPYEKRYRFSQQFIRESKEPGAPVIRSGRLQLLDFTVSYKDSGYFKTEVKSVGHKPLVREHLGTLGSFGLRFGKPVIESGKFRFPVRARADQVNIDIVNASPYPSCFQAAEWTGAFVMDAKRL